MTIQGVGGRHVAYGWGRGAEWLALNFNRLEEDWYEEYDKYPWNHYLSCLHTTVMGTVSVPSVCLTHGQTSEI